MNHFVLYSGLIVFVISIVVVFVLSAIAPPNDKQIDKESGDDLF